LGKERVHIHVWEIRKTHREGERERIDFERVFREKFPKLI